MKGLRAMIKKLRLWLIKKLNATPNDVLLQIKSLKTELSTVTLSNSVNISSQAPSYGSFVVDRIKQELAYEFGKEVLKYATVDTHDFGGFAKYDVKVTVVVPENKRGVDIFDY